MTAPTDPQPKPLAEAREDREKIVARLRAAYVLVEEWPERKSDGFVNLLALRNLVPAACDLIEADGKRLAELEAFAPGADDSEDDGRDWELGHADPGEPVLGWAKRRSASPATETDALRDAVKAALAPWAGLLNTFKDKLAPHGDDQHYILNLDVRIGDLRNAGEALAALHTPSPKTDA